MDPPASKNAFDHDEVGDIIDDIARRITEEDWSSKFEDSQYNNHRWERKNIVKSILDDESLDDDSWNMVKGSDKQELIESRPRCSMVENPTDIHSVADLVKNMDLMYHNRLLMAVGFSVFGDAVEIVATLFLAMQVNENRLQCALIVSSIFAGMVVGTIIFNIILEPIFGKRIIFNVTSIIRPILGFMTLVVPRDYQSIMVVRFLIGTMTSGRVSAFQVLDEFSTNSRPNIWIYIQFFWTAGVIFVVFVGSMTGWVNMMIILELSILLTSILSVMWFLESPKWLLQKDRTEEAFYIIGDRSTGFDWLIGISQSPETKASTYEKWRLRALWFCFGLLYYGAMYLVHDRYYNNRDYYGTIVVCAEIEIIGILMGWYGITKIGAKWTQFIGFSLSTYGIFFMTFFMDEEEGEDNDVILIIFASLARFSLMVAATGSLTYAQNEYLTDSIAFCMSHIGGVVCPFLIDSSMGVVISCFLLQTVLLLYFFT